MKLAELLSINKKELQQEKKMKFLYVLFFVAIVYADKTKDKRDTFLAPIRQTFVRPVLVNKVVQPIIQDVIQPVHHHKEFQTIVNPVQVQHMVGAPVMQNTVFTNRFVKRSAEKAETKDKRDTFLAPIRQTFVRPVLVNKVVQPIIQDVVQPVVTQKEFRTIVNPVQNQHLVGTPVVNRFIPMSGRFV